MCHTELTQVDGTDSIVGDEAHIRSPKDGGPRFDVGYPSEQLNTYENLLLLCKIHHKLVDDNPAGFPAELLEEIKRNHEVRVAEALDPQQRTNWVHPPALAPLDNGTQIMGVVMNADAFVFDHVHPETDTEADLMAAFLQNAKDWGEIASEIEQSGQVRAAMNLHEQLKELRSAGFVVLGGRGQYRHASGVVFDTAALRVMREAEEAP